MVQVSKGAIEVFFPKKNNWSQSFACAGFPTDSKPSDWAEYMPLWREYRYKVFGGKAQEEINALFDYTPPYQLSDGDALFVNSPFLNIYGKSGGTCHKFVF